MLNDGEGIADVSHAPTWNRGLSRTHFSNRAFICRGGIPAAQRQETVNRSRCQQPFKLKREFRLILIERETDLEAPMSSEFSAEFQDNSAAVFEDMNPIFEEIGQVKSIRDSLTKVTAELGRIAREVPAINAYFRVRIQQAIEETQAAVEQQAQARLEQEVDRTRELVRQMVTDELQSQLQAEVSRLKSEFQREMQTVSAHWQAERARLNEEVAQSRRAASRVLRNTLEEFRRFESFVRTFDDGLAEQSDTPPSASSASA